LKKKLIFFDGDGTLWYPRATKRTQKPHWVYHDVRTKDTYLEHLMLTPHAKETLEVLKRRGYYLVLISASPDANEVALTQIKEKLEYFNIMHLFHSYHASNGNNPSGKAAIMLEGIDKLDLDKEDALMVGDSYFYDYKAAMDIGIDALFIENTVSKMPDHMPNDLRPIKEIDTLVTMLD
jgi:phosphoglycolate phosphatase-like HAD superfamily hydrolase